MAINEIQDNIIDEFSALTDWMDKYEYLIELGRELSPYDEKYKTDNYLINGCQARVWVRPEIKGDTVIYTADSDAIITKGMISLLIRVLSNQSPANIIDADLYFLDRIGLKENLSPTRANGLLSMLNQMKLYAIAFDSKQRDKKQ